MVLKIAGGDLKDLPDEYIRDKLTCRLETADGETRYLDCTITPEGGLVEYNDSGLIPMDDDHQGELTNFWEGLDSLF